MPLRVPPHPLDDLGDGGNIDTPRSAEDWVGKKRRNSEPLPWDATGKDFEDPFKQPNKEDVGHVSR